jgi:hypothetical protein
VLQFAALADAAHQGLAVDGYDGFQHPCGHVGQLAKSLLGRRKETLEFGDGGRSLLALDAERLVVPQSFRPCSGGFLYDRRRERASGKRLAFRLGLDEGRPLDVEPLPDNLDCVLEVSMCRSRIKESLPEEAVALVRVSGVVPAPQLFDHDGEINRGPFDQRPCRPQRLGELLR